MLAADAPQMHSLRWGPAVRGRAQARLAVALALRATPQRVLVQRGRCQPLATDLPRLAPSASMIGPGGGAALRERRQPIGTAQGDEQRVTHARGGTASCTSLRHSLRMS